MRGEVGASLSPEFMPRLRASQVVPALRRRTGSGSQGELGLPGAVPAHWQRDAVVAFRMRVCAPPGLPLTRHSPFSLCTLSPKFLFGFCLVAPRGNDPEEDEGSASYSVPGWQRCLCFRDKPSIRKISTVCELLRQGSLELAWLPGFVSPAASHTISCQGSWHSASLVPGGAEQSTAQGLLPVIFPKPV